MHGELRFLRFGGMPFLDICSDRTGGSAVIICSLCGTVLRDGGEVVNAGCLSFAVFRQQGTDIAHAGAPHAAKF